MSVVDLKIGARSFQLACEEGQESHLKRLANDIDVKIESLSRQMRTGNESLLFLMTALMLQDELNEVNKKLEDATKRSQGIKEEDMSIAINTISDYLETLVDKIEAKKAA